MSWNFRSEKPYFVYDPEGDGFSYFATEEERDQYAKTCIESYLDNDGWYEHVEFITAGKVTHKATKTNINKRPPDNELDEDGCDSEGVYWGHEFNETCNYELKPVGGLGDE